MFHFPTFPPHTLYIQMRVTRHHSCWVSPFGHPRISARLTAPRGLSQPPTSFIGSWCQGIHRTLLHTYNKDARVHCAVLKQHTPPELTVTPDPPTPPPPRGPRQPRYDTSGRCIDSCLEKTHSRVFSQDPTVHRYRTHRHPTQEAPHVRVLVVSVPPMSSHPTRERGRHGLCALPHPPVWTVPAREMLLRKEVIQPHLPVRLPCYDFVPIADPTFDGSLHKG